LSIACPDPPFPISSNIVGGGGCLAPRANGTGIVGLEATFEFGRVRTFGFGPLTSAGRITLGLQFRAGKGESAKLGINFMARVKRYLGRGLIKAQP